jgi:predicted amidohydrolase
LVNEAGDAGAAWIVLPEFFPSGMGFSAKLRDAALPFDGQATELLLSAARRYRAHVGGSFLCRDPDGHVRNAFVLANADGIVGRHDKDTPTLWENCWYIGGSDTGLLELPGLKLGIALCAELGRTATAKRLRSADLVIGGSFTWHAPDYLPRWLGQEGIDRRLFSEISSWASPFARLVGAPVVEATHCGTLACRDQLLPLEYRCRIGDGTKICRADGEPLASRAPEAGPGVILADVTVGAVTPLDPLPERTWIRPLGPLGNAFWYMQRRHGEAWYRKQHAARGNS